MGSPKENGQEVAIETLADDFRKRLRSGRRATIAQYVRRYPDHADDIRDMFPAIEALEQLRRGDDQQREADRRRAAGRVRPAERIGDYRILREIGRGGMGIVYEAVQQSLKRRVALKLLAADLVESPKELERFRREAQSAGSLHHTNIVPVLDVGRHEDRHYYVMQFIEGVGLDAVLAELGRAGVDGDHRPATAARHAADALCDGTLWQGRKSVSSAAVESRTIAREPTIADDAAPREPTAAETPTRALETWRPEEARPAPPRQELPVVEARGRKRLGRRYWMSVARIGTQLADALDYAHRHGILHRDVKPSNLLLDGDGVAWIADFGLAKHEDAEGLTRTGDLVGTLRYMAPECFQGRSDARSDVHGLGLTLYEMLTLRPAFEETRHGPLIRQKTVGELPRPRNLDPTIPRDLETIALKACATDPKDRYATAGELAADLQRFLEDRPIEARRATPVGRLWRWSRRNPMVAALGGVALALLCLVAAVSSIGAYRTNAALGQAETNRQLAVEAAEEANAQRALAETNLQMAVGAFEEMIDKIASRGIPDSLDEDLEEGRDAYAQAATTAADAELLQTLLEFFDRFAERNQADLTEPTAVAHRRIGDIRQRLGQFDEAEVAYRKALEIRRSLAEAKPNDATHVLAQAQIVNALGVMDGKRGDRRAAVAAHLEAAAMLEAVHEASDSVEAKAALARTYNLLGAVGASSGVGTLREMMQALVPAARRPARAILGRAMIGAKFRPAQAEDCLPKALTLLDELTREDPDRAEYRLELAECYRNHARQAWSDGDREEADTRLSDAIRVLDQLVADFPDVFRYKYELADTLLLVDFSVEPSPADFGANIDRAVAIGEQLVAACPNVAHYRALLADGLSRRAAIHREAGRIEEAEKDYERAVAYQRALLEQFDAIAAYRLAYVQSLHGLALLKRETGDARRARELLDTAIGHLKEGMESAGDKQQRYQPFHGPLYVSLSRTLYDLDENELAQEAADLAQRIRPTPGGGPRYRFGHFGRPMPGHLMPGPMKPSPMMPSPMMPSPMMPDSRQPGPPGRRGRGPLVP